MLLLSASLDIYQASAALRAHSDARPIHVNIDVALPTRALCPEKSIPPPRCSCLHNCLQTVEVSFKSMTHFCDRILGTVSLTTRPKGPVSEPAFRAQKRARRIKQLVPTLPQQRAEKRQPSSAVLHEMRPFHANPNVPFDVALPSPGSHQL